MTLSSSDVEQKTFSTALRGYDLDEVDDFLDEIVATIRDLSDQLAAAKQAPSPAAPLDRAGAGEGLDEGAVGRALIAAQETADQIIAEARRDAERIVKEADTEADLMVSERDQRKANAEAEMKLLTDHVAGVRAQLAVLATAVADRLDEMDESIGLPEGLSGEGESDSPDDGSLSEDEAGGRGRSESGRHAGAGEHLDDIEDVEDDDDEVPDNVEALILDDRDDAESSDEDAADDDIADSSERGW